MLSLDAFAALEAGVRRAEEQWRQGDLTAALHSYTDLLAQRLASGQEAVATLTAADLVVIERLADLAVPLGYAQAADDLLTSMVALNERAGNRYGADYASLKRIHLALGCGRLRDAYALLQAMQPGIGDLQSIEFSPSGLAQWEARRSWPGTSRADRAVLFSRLYLEMGRLLAALGQYGDALVALERGLSHTGKDAPDLAWQAIVPLRLAIASALLEKGELTAARSWLTDLAPALAERQQPGLAVRWLELSGKLNLLQGEFGPALVQFRRVLDTCQARSLHQAELAATLNLAHILVYLNHTRAAKELLIGAREGAARLNATAFVARINILLRMADARGHALADGVPIAPSVSEMWGVVTEAASTDADVYHEPFLDIPQSDNYLAFFEDRVLGIHWQLGRRDLGAAARLLAQMQEAFEWCDSALIRLRLRVLGGMLAYYQDDLQQAAWELDAVRPTLFALGLKPERWQVQRFLGWCWSRLGRPTAELHALAEDTHALLTAMTASLSATDQAVFQLNKWTAEEEYIAIEANQLARMKARLLTGSWLLRPWRRWSVVKRLNTLLQHIDRYKDVLAARTIDGRDVSIQRVAALSLWRRLWRHPRHRITLSFLVLPDRLLVIRAGWFSLDFGVSAITRLQVRDLVRRWHETIIQANDRRRGLGTLPPASVITTTTDAGKSIAGRLAESLQIPALLRTLPQRICALTIVPDDSLHGFPFAAIVHNGKYLAEHYALAVAFTHDGRSAPPRPADRQEALTVAVSQGMGQFRTLPGTHTELEQVETWLTGRKLPVRRLMDAAADKAAVLSHLPGAAFLHVACHGIFEPNRPDRSGMVLIPGPEQMEILSLRELSSLPLTGLQHVTLSACWSADHFVIPGRWIISLPQTLWRAGAQSVLGCLWEVDDTLAVPFMTRFYACLDELLRDEALRRTQLDCLHGALPGCDGINTAAPMYWAGYTLYGDCSPLRL